MAQPFESFLIFGERRRRVILLLGHQLTGLMTLVLALDRIFAVVFPLKHYVRRADYAWKCLAGFV